jgi:nicotinic acetylcholine receptor alpha-6
MFHITEFKEVSEQLTTVLLLYLIWEDYRLTWDPLDHNGTQYINIPVTKIWKPSLLLSSPVDKNSLIGDNQNWMVVKCLYDGRIWWSNPDIVTSKCDIDIRYFPFDTQFCKLHFVPFGYHKEEVLLRGQDENVRLMFYTENGGWILEDSQISYGYSFFGEVSECAISLQLKRRPHYFLVNVVLPIIFTSFLSVLVFFIPLESGGAFVLCRFRFPGDGCIYDNCW